MNVFWTALIVSLFMTSACKSVPKNRGPGYVPAALQCPTDTDPNCIGGSTAAVRVPISPPPDQVRESGATAENRFISGRCELIEAGSSKPRSCEGLRLVVRSTRDNEERVARFNGYGFQIDDLKEGADYRIEAMSGDQRYDVKTDTPTLRPGQKTRVRVITVPRL